MPYSFTDLIVFYPQILRKSQKRNTKRIKGYQKGACMTRKNFRFIILGILLLSTSGCALLGIAASAAASYGIYQATRK